MNLKPELDCLKMKERRRKVGDLDLVRLWCDIEGREASDEWEAK
jgi:hypothetical protein